MPDGNLCSFISNPIEWREDNERRGIVRYEIPRDTRETQVAMAENQSKLNIPVYEATPEEEILDAEVIYDESLGRGPGLRGRLSGRAQNVRQNGLRDAFITQPRDARREARGENDPKLRARQARRVEHANEAEARQRQRQIDAEQRERLEQLKTAAANGDAASALKLAVARSGAEYMESLRLSGILDTKHTPETQRKQLEGIHKTYASMMVLQCVSPLQSGMSAGSLISVLGMGASMWTLSPDFRTQMGSFVDQLKDGVRAKISERQEKENQQEEKKLGKQLAKADGYEDLLSKRWRQRYDRMMYAKRGHRLPFSNESAAMTEIALAETAYAELRQPGADVAAVREQYDTALASLYGYVRDDGLNPEDVSRSMRVIVGRRMEREPELASVFGELGHGAFAKTPPRKMSIPGQDEPVTVWTGDFNNAFGATISSGSFKLREATDLEGHRGQMRQTIFVEMAKARDAHELNDVLTQYSAGAAVGRNPAAVDTVTDPDTRRRLGRVRAMFSSMAHDGMNEQEREFAYNTACIDALEAVPYLNTEVVKTWARQYGSQWRDKVTESVHIYDEAGVHPSSDLPEERVAHEGSSRHFVASADGEVDDSNAYVGFDYEDEDIVDAEIVEDDDLESAADGRVDGIKIRDAEDERRRHKAPQQIIRARVNQEYNANDTGRVLGIGSDDSTGPQDPDFELG